MRVMEHANVTKDFLEMLAMVNNYYHYMLKIRMSKNISLSFQKVNVILTVNQMEYACQQQENAIAIQDTLEKIVQVFWLEGLLDQYVLLNNTNPFYNNTLKVFFLELYPHIKCLIQLNTFTAKECPKISDKVCNNQGLCNERNGTCICNKGFFGDACNGKILLLLDALKFKHQKTFLYHFRDSM